MRHQNRKATLNRPADQRKALVRNLLTSLFLYGKVKTTHAKALVLSAEAEKLITKVKRQSESFNGIRELNKVLFTEDACKKAFDYSSKSKKTSGFTRSVKLGMRVGDNATITQVELIHDS